MPKCIGLVHSSLLFLGHADGDRHAGKSSGRKSSRSTASVRRSDGRSDVETVSSSMESDRKSAEVDPEWKKNMGLLINKQDGTVPNVSPRGGTPRAAATPSAKDREIVYGSAESSHQEESRKQLPVEEYNFSFDDSRNSSGREEDNVESISIRTRTVLHGTDEGYSGSDDWAYERLGQASTPSTKTSHSELTSKADRESERRAFTEPLELLELEAFDAYDERYLDVRQVEVEVEGQRGQQPEVEVAELDEGCPHAFMNQDRSADENLIMRTSQSAEDGDCQLHTSTERTATFPRSVRSSRSSHPEKSPGGSPPKSPPGSPKASGSNRAASARNSGRINENSMSFSFTIPNQPKYAENWEWLEECSGVDPTKLQGNEPCLPILVSISSSLQNRISQPSRLNS